MGRRDKKRSHPPPPLYYPSQNSPGNNPANSEPVEFDNLDGQIADDQVPESAVTQHEGALEIAPEQITGWPADAEGFLKNDGAGNLSWEDPTTPVESSGRWEPVVDTTDPDNPEILFDVGSGGDGDILMEEASD